MPHRGKGGKSKLASMLSLASKTAKHDSHLHKAKHAHHSEQTHDSTGVKEMGNVGKQLHAIKASLHLMRRKTETEAEISSRPTMKSHSHHDESALSRTHLRAAPAAIEGNGEMGECCIFYLHVPYSYSSR
ncbi:hypothetical protein MTO96_007369 [Rhipicephalus appendiculatus]